MQTRWRLSIGILYKVCIFKNEVHFPSKHPGGKIEYDCSNMLNYYVCRYSHKYCSEIEYALNEVENLKELNVYNIMSIGCGASPDLMALEHYRQKNDLNTPIVYSGYDKNRLWEPAHEKIKNYGKDNGIRAHFEIDSVVLRRSEPADKSKSSGQIPAKRLSPVVPLSVCFTPVNPEATSSYMNFFPFSV